MAFKFAAQKQPLHANDCLRQVAEHLCVVLVPLEVVTRDEVLNALLDELEVRLEHAGELLHHLREMQSQGEILSVKNHALAVETFKVFALAATITPHSSTEFKVQCAHVGDYTQSVFGWCLMTQHQRELKHDSPT